MKNFIEQFLENVNLHPDKTALVFDGESMSYRELETLSARIASRLIRLGACKEKIYPIVLERGFSYIAAVIGILRSGAAYSPLSAEYPKERVDFIVSDSGADLIIDDAFLDGIDEERILPEFPVIAMEDAAVAIYTSGSTGRPKGILHDHWSFTNAIVRQLGIAAKADDIEMSVTPFSFAISTHDILTPLWAGAQIHILSEAQRKDILFIDKYIDEHNITASVISPQLLKQLPVRESSLKLVNSGGERISGIYSPYTVIRNAYGLSELLSIAMTFELDKAYDNTPIGRPLPGFKALLLDENGRQVPDGEEGELCIAGTMARGYINLPELTAAVFAENPYSEDETDRRLLHTKDICKRLPDGSIVYVNRKDWMVKINGQRVEPGEIETIIKKTDGIFDAAVKSFTNNYGQVYLVAYYVEKKPVGADALREKISQKLPPYMIPAFFVKLDNLPVNANGKLDRNALEAPEAGSFKNEYTAPETDIQKILCDAFGKILGIGNIGADDDFFALGGDSIKSVMVTKECGSLDLSTAVIFEGRTPRRIDHILNSRTQKSRTAKKEKKETVCQLSPSERGMYLEQKLNGDSVEYNVNVAVILKGAGSDTVRKTLDDIFSAHEAFHSYYGEQDGMPVRIVSDKNPVILEKSAETRDEVISIINSSAEPFDLTAGIPVRAVLYSVADGCVILHLNIHHIAFDGDSVKLFADELISGLNGNGIHPAAFDLSDLEPGISEETRRTGMEFYKKMFADGIPVNDMPIKGKRPKVHPVSDREIVFGYNSEQDKSIGKTAQKYGVSRFELIFSAIAMVIGKYTDSEDIVLGIPTDMRPGGAENVIGMFVNTSPVRVKPVRCMKLGDYLSSVSDTVRTATRLAALPFEDVVAGFVGSRDESRHPVFDVSVNYLPEFPIYDQCGLSAQVYAPMQKMRRDISFNIRSGKEGLRFIVQYPSELFSDEVMEDLLQQLRSTLAIIVSDTAGTVGGALAMPEEQEKKLKAFSQTAKADIPVTLLHRMFERTAAENADKTALIASDKTLTFAQLDETANIIANGLIKRGVKKGDSVVLLLPRRSYYFAALFGVLKAGAAFIPCDPQYPAERISHIIEDSDARFVLTASNKLTEFPAEKTLDIGVLLGGTDTARPDIDVSPEDLAYMIYTSGSTGKPKGVMLRHIGICSYLTPHPANLHMHFLSENTNCYLSVTTVSFDMSFKEHTAALCNGKTLVFADEEEMNDPRALAELMKKHNVDCFNATPSRLQQYIGYAPFREMLGKCKLVMSGGEGYPISLRDDIRKCSDKIRIMNTYGPTEITVSCNAADLTNAQCVTVGRPLLNYSEYIVDSFGELAPFGVQGELYIGGPGLAAGYKGLDEQTKQKFITYRGERMYRSGDRAKWDKNGNISILGRFDTQVKLRGLRIELDEIQGLIEKQPGITKAVVIIGSVNGRDELCAYFTADRDIDIEGLRSELKKHLTNYMIPASIMRLDSIPLTPNGKTDTKALPAPVIAAETMTPPQNDVQQRVFDAVAKTIGSTQFGIETELYAAGLTSLNSVSLCIALSEEFGVNIRIRDLRDNDTVRKIAEFIGTAGDEEDFEISEEYPVTKTQEGIYFETVSHPDTTIYNIPTLLKLGDGIEPGRLRRAIAETVNAHPYLMTSFFIDNKGVIRQKRCRSAFGESQIEYLHCGDIDGIQNSLVKPFNLQSDRLFRFELIETNDGNYMFFDVHHIVFDGESKKILLRDISAAYAGEKLTPEKYSGYEAALAEEKLRAGAHYEKSKKYYSDLLDGVESDCLPINDIISADQPRDSGILNITGKENIASVVREYCKNNNVGENAYCTAIFGWVLGKYCGREDSVFTTVNNGRNDPRFRDSVSMFVRTYPVLCTFENTDIPEYINGIGKQLSDSLSFDVYSFAEISHDLGITADILFVYQNLLSDSRNFGFCGENAESITLGFDEEKAKLEILIYPEGDSFSYHISYASDKYTEGFIKDMITVYERALEEFGRNTDMNEIQLVDDDMREQLDGLNHFEHDYEVTDLVTMFRRQAKKTPDNIAVVYLDNTYTYREVDRITENIAGFLKAKGIGKNQAVSVMIPRCEYMPIAAVGILKAGAGYQPLDPTYPSERLEFMIKDADAKYLIADRSLMDRIPNYDGPVLYTDEIPSLPDAERIAEDPDPCDLFIMLYTSGSTGVPKGVMLEHRNLCCFCNWYIKTYGVDEHSRASAYASYGFDCHMLDMYPVLLCGGQLHIIDESIRLDMIAINKYFRDNGITHTFMTTQVGRQYAALYPDADAPRHLSAAGEKLVPVEPPRGFKLYNGYGPTECTIFTHMYPVEKMYDRVPIGTPLFNMKQYIVDKNLNRLSFGMPGELIVAGHQVGRGYLNRPEKNAEVFIRNPFSDEPGYEHAYRTGDVVRILRNGTADFIGRNDSQVKIRGFRIELTEIEGVIRRFPGIKDATVQAFDSPAGGKFVAAYVVSDGPVDIKAMNDFIMRDKPSYMVPAVTMQIDSIPLNQNQKVNRRALPEPVFEHPTGDDEQTVRSMTLFEQEIAKVVKKSIGDTEINPVKALTYYGLSSISAIGLVTTLSDRFGIHYPVAKLIDGASIVDIEDFIFSEWDKAGAPGAASINEDIPVSEKKDEYPLSSVQLAVYYDTMKRAADISYNIPTCLAFTDIDCDRLAEAVKAAVRAHSCLNAHIEVRGGQLVQVRADDIRPEVPVTMLTENEIEAHKHSFVRPFDLEESPLYRFEIVKTENRTYLFSDIHHIVFDGFSLSVLMRDISRAYNGETLVPEKYTAFDYALADSEYKNSERYKGSEEHFAKLLASFESPSSIPADRHKDPEHGAIGEAEALVPKKAVESYCRENGLTPNALFLAGSFYTVSRFAANKEVYISTISSGRGDVKLSNSVGMFVHTIPLAMDFNKEMTASQLIKTSSEVMRGSIANEDYPFAELAAKYGYSTEIMYECQIGIISDGGKLGGHEYDVVPISSESPKFKVSIVIFERSGSYVIRVRYNDALYTKRYMQTLADALAISVKTMYEQPDAPVKHISLINEEQHKKLLRLGQGEKADIPVKLLHRMFEQAAKKNSDRTALIACDKTLTYTQLNDTANIIANGLISFGTGKGDRIVLLLPRRSFYFAAVFGVLKAGAVFIPCDPQYPADRINHIIRNSDAKIILTTSDKLPDYPAEKALDIENLLTGSDISCPDVDVSPEDLAYMIYTSGSTGKPKGVMLRHEGICNYVTPNDGNPMFRSVRDVTEVMVTVTTVSFDMSFKDSIGVLCNGKTVVFADEEQMNDPCALAELFAATHADSFNATPSRIRQYLDYGKFREETGRLKLLVCGAEQYPEALLTQIKELGIPVIINTYGPTEITVSSNMAYLMDSDHISVGRPITNCTEYIVDADGNLLPEGVMGELLIGGPGVAAGYVDMPEKTAAGFIEYNGERVYRSGDYARWDKDGNVIILGRIDGQVKLRGLRIEPSEIEGLMEKQPGIKRAVVVVRKLNGQDNLCAYFTAENKTDIHALRDALAEKLTHYMVPAAFTQLDEIPVTPNGKTDLRALPEPTAISGGEYTAPTNETEEFFCKLFGKVLSLGKVGINDDFFSVGGTSLSAASIMAGASENGYNVTFGDVFKLKTPAALASKFVRQDHEYDSDPSNRFDDYDYTAINELLAGNTLEAFESGEKRPIGNILLTGSTGYMGMHVLAEYLRSQSGIAWCLARKGRYADPMIRLKNMLFYYFNDEFEDKYDRIRVINGDVTNYDVFGLLENEPIDTVFNCAASVKHFSSGTDIEDINVGGAANCVRFCEKTGARLIHFSTTSVGGGMIVSNAAELCALDEKSLYFGQLLDNQYTISKLLSERTVLEAAAEHGLDAKVIRVGTLAARESDGEFQINFLTNSFMERLRSYVILGCIPYSRMSAVMRLGPIDTSARGFMMLAQTPKACCLFNAINNHTIPTIDVIRVMQDLGLGIAVVDNDKFAAALTEAQKDPHKAAILASMLAYKVSSNVTAVQTKCEYTTQVLARMGFFWNLTDSRYIRKFVESLYTLGFFDTTNLNR